MEVQDVMSSSVRSIGAFEPIRTAARAMGEADVGSLPVLDNGKLVGMVSIGDLVRKDPDQQEVAEALSEICEPSKRHCQQLASV